AFSSMGDSFLELSLIRENNWQEESGHHGRISGLAKPFPAQIAFEQRLHVEEKFLGPPIVASAEEGYAEVEVSRHPEWDISKRLGDGLGILSEGDRLRGMTGHPEGVTHVDGQLTDSPLIPERTRQRFGLAETTENPRILSQGKECSAEVEP